MRLTDVKVMDIYAAAAAWVSDSLAMNAALPGLSASATASALAPLDRWMEFALLVEDMQGVMLNMWQSHCSHAYCRIDVQDKV